MDIFNITAMAPFPTGTADCIDLPLFFNIFAASASAIELDATKAEYSPNECPAQ